MLRTLLASCALLSMIIMADKAMERDPLPTVQTAVSEEIRRDPRPFLTELLTQGPKMMQAAIHSDPDLFNDIVNERCFDGDETIIHVVCGRNDLVSLRILLTIRNVDLYVQNQAGLIPIQNLPSITRLVQFVEVAGISPAMAAFVRSGPEFIIDQVQELIHDNKWITIRSLSRNQELINAIDNGAEKIKLKELIQSVNQRSIWSRLVQRSDGTPPLWLAFVVAIFCIVTTFFYLQSSDAFFV